VGEVYEEDDWDEGSRLSSSMYKLAHRREQSMKTFEELKTLFTQELLELEKLAGNWPSTIEQRHVKEQEIGRQCYEAEEDLSQLELNTLKRALGINDSKWRAYKAKFIEGSSPEELV
jgi:cytochrome c-type biogenesis protein CcmH/NrfG